MALQDFESKEGLGPLTHHSSHITTHGQIVLNDNPQDLHARDSLYIGQERRMNHRLAGALGNCNQLVSFGGI